MQSQVDVEKVMDEVVRATAELFGCGAEAGISVAHRKRRVEAGASSSVSVRRGDELQNELSEGPCLDAIWDHDQVYAGDLPHDQRWPQWGPRMAEEFGIRTMLSTQLFADDDHLGAPNIYSTKPDAFDEEHQETARLLAAHAAVAVAAAQEIRGLKFAIDRRTTIGKALGIIMIEYDLDDDRAFTVLRRLSSHHNRKLYDITQDVIRTRGLPQN